MIAVWTPTFTQFLHDHLAATMTLAEASPYPAGKCTSVR